jgi:hypothetical protein
MAIAAISGTPAFSWFGLVVRSKNVKYLCHDVIYVIKTENETRA